MQKPLSKPKRVLVGMSGGIHSAVTAALLKSEGYQVSALHLELIRPEWFEGEAASPRCSRNGPASIERIRGFCEKLGIPFQKRDARELYEDKVVDHLIHEFMQNRMPHPCFPCNLEVKFELLFAHAAQEGFDFVGTGHSARVIHDTNRNLFRLHKGSDPTREQSQLLFGLSQERLKKLLLPLGGISHNMIRQLASQFGFSGVDPDPVGAGDTVCFISDGSYRGLVEKRVPAQLRPKGIIRTTESRVAGQHEGLHRHKIGETAGLDFVAQAQNGLFVLAFEAKSQTLIVGSENELLRRELLLTGARWIQRIDGLRGRKAQARLRPYGQAEIEVSCHLTEFENDMVLVRFDEPQRAVPPGQPVTFYEGDEVLGGGFVERIGAS